MAQTHGFRVYERENKWFCTYFVDGKPGEIELRATDVNAAVHEVARMFAVRWWHVETPLDAANKATQASARIAEITGDRSEI